MYKNAFNCAKCPQTNSEKGCPVWWELMMENPSGEQKLVKDCGYKLMPFVMTEVIKASNRPAAAIEQMRNSTAEALKSGFMNLARFAITTKRVQQFPAEKGDE